MIVRFEYLIKIRQTFIPNRFANICQSVFGNGKKVGGVLYSHFIDTKSKKPESFKLSGFLNKGVLSP